MTRKIRERAELAWLVEVGSEFSISLDALQPLYVRFLDHIFPEAEKSTEEDREAAYQRIFDYVEDLEPNAQMTVRQAVQVGELKRHSRSDQFWARKTMMNIGALEHTSKTTEHFVKRLTNGSNK